MIRIRRIYNDRARADKIAIEKVKELLSERFRYFSEGEIDALIQKFLGNAEKPFRYLFFIAERPAGVRGVCLASVSTSFNYFYLDYLAANASGIGAAVYEHLREEAVFSKAEGIFLECVYPDRRVAGSEQEHRENLARLRFYERYGAVPILNTAFEEPRSDRSRFHLVFDPLGKSTRLSVKWCREAAREILREKHSRTCDAEYVKRVVQSFTDEPVALHLISKAQEKRPKERKERLPSHRRLALVVNEGHQIHHVRERGYVEAPVRVAALMESFEKLDFFERLAVKKFPDAHVLAVHSADYYHFLKTLCRSLPDHASLYPEVFPVRGVATLPQELNLQTGYYCIDTFTPLSANAFKAARGAVDCTLTAAQTILEGRSMAYALVRPPGHHAGPKYFGGFCYLNSAAIAAHFLSQEGRVALLDIDYHHGNGQQDIFYDRADVLTISIHADPAFAYPHFSGYVEERGQAAGEGYNLNIVLPEVVGEARYLKALDEALRRIEAFAPTFLIVSLGFDGAKGDPTGTWELQKESFQKIGEQLASLELHTLVVQEGGYLTRKIGINATSFFRGLAGATS